MRISSCGMCTVYMYIRISIPYTGTRLNDTIITCVRPCARFPFLVQCFARFMTPRRSTDRRRENASSPPRRYIPYACESRGQFYYYYRCTNSTRLRRPRVVRPAATTSVCRRVYFAQWRCTITYDIIIVITGAGRCLLCATVICPGPDTNHFRVFNTRALASNTAPTVAQSVFIRGPRTLLRARPIAQRRRQRAPTIT